MKGPSLVDLAVRPTAEAREVAATKKAAKDERKSAPHVSVYISDAVNKEIRKLALELDVKAHDLYLEGIDRMLKAHGRPSIAKIDGKT
jgi:hypothetical protein